MVHCRPPTALAGKLRTPFYEPLPQTLKLGNLAVTGTPFLFAARKTAKRPREFPFTRSSSQRDFSYFHKFVSHWAADAPNFPFSLSLSPFSPNSDSTTDIFGPNLTDFSPVQLSSSSETSRVLIYWANMLGLIFLVLGILCFLQKYTSHTFLPPNIASGLYSTSTVILALIIIFVSAFLSDCRYNFFCLLSVAPTRVSLKGRGQEETLEVTEGEQVTLECIVEAAKPVASVVWYKNDRRIALGEYGSVTCPIWSDYGYKIFATREYQTHDNVYLLKIT